MRIAFLPFHQRTRQISRGMWAFVSVCVAPFVALGSSATTAPVSFTTVLGGRRSSHSAARALVFAILAMMVVSLGLTLTPTSAVAANTCPALTDSKNGGTGSIDETFLCALLDFTSAGVGLIQELNWDSGQNFALAADQFVVVNNLNDNDLNDQYISMFVHATNQPGGGAAGTFSVTPNRTHASGETFHFTAAQAYVGITVTLTSGGLDYYMQINASGNTIDGFTVVQGTPPSADSTPPTVAITGVPAETNDPFTATYTFNEEMDPATLDLADVQAGLSNATASNLQTATADTVFTALITPNGTGPVTVALLANAADDLAGNGNLASGVSLAQHTSPQDVARQQIGEYVAARHSLIMQNRPSTQRRLSRFSDTGIAGGETLSVLGMSVANPARFAMAFAGNELSFAMRSDRVAPVLNAFAAGDGLDTIDAYENDTRVTFWTEGRFTLFDDDATDNGRFGVVHAGVDYLVNERVLLGFSAQVDWLSQDNASNAGSLNGVGWLAGPTLTLQVQDNFYVDLAAALGQSYNDINPLGTYTDEFTTNRLFLSGGLIGDFEVGLFTLQPSVSFSYIAEEQKAYTDSNAALVASQTLSQGEVRFGPKIARTISLAGGDSLSAFASLDGVYTFGDAGDYADGSLAADMIGFTGSTELGATYATRSGLALTIAANYGGIGSDANLYGGRISLSVPLN